MNEKTENEKTEMTLYKAEPQVEIIDKSTERPEGAFDCTFRMTVSNNIKLMALAKYAMMLDWVTNAKGEECLNTDGIINLILDEGMTRRVKDIAKKHGFYDSDDFITTMGDCGDGVLVYEGYINVGAVLPGMKVTVRLWATHSLFEDGTGVHTFTEEDFDEGGGLSFSVFTEQVFSTCMSIYLYVGDVLVHQLQ